MRSTRNFFPCQRCTDRHEKCDIWPPNSPDLCKSCKSAKLTQCVPRVRKYDERDGMRPSFFISTAQLSSTASSNTLNSSQSQDKDVRNISIEDTSGGPLYGPEEIPSTTPSTRFQNQYESTNYGSTEARNFSGSDYRYYIDSSRPSLQQHIQHGNFQPRIGDSNLPLDYDGANYNILEEEILQHFYPTSYDTMYQTHESYS